MLPSDPDESERRPRLATRYAPRDLARRRGIARKREMDSNGLRRGDAHIATKAGVAGHPSHPVGVAPPPAPRSSVGVRLGGGHYDRRLASMNECPIYTVAPLRVFGARETGGTICRSGRFDLASRDLRGNGDSEKTTVNGVAGVVAGNVGARARSLEGRTTRASVTPYENGRM